MIENAQRRFLDILASIYIYNEHRGYSSIWTAFLAGARAPFKRGWFIAAVEKHRRDERKHYLMFKKYFEELGCMPCGRPFLRAYRPAHLPDVRMRHRRSRHRRCHADDELFRLCRIIMITEIRGMNQPTYCSRTSW
ncbi:MAG: hypothetical protein R3C55_16495 [Parvularculaceae bacterium]